METPKVGETAVSKMERFSCDLVEESKSHVAFLQTLHLNGISILKPSLESFRRYSELWLPLVNSHYRHHQNQNQNDKSQELHGLVPPGDVAWLWHCHRLAPYRYAKYVQNTFAPSSTETSGSGSGSGSGSDDLFVLDPKYPFVLQLEDNTTNATFDTSKHGDAAHHTARLWKEHYPNEPFFLPPADNGQTREKGDEAKTPVGAEEETALQSTSLGGFDVIESCERQKAFLWQVSQTNFHSDEFLAQGVDNYFKFVSLMKRGEEKPRFLVPTYQIDLMWHTHILHSIEMYHVDCKKIISS